MRGRNTQARKSTNRSTVAAALASDDHGQLDGPARVGHDVPEQRQRTRRQAQPEPEDEQTLELVPAGALASADTEGEPPVGRGVDDAGDEQRDDVRRDRAHHPAEQQEQQQVRERARHADRREPDELARHRGRHPRDGRSQRGAAELGAQFGDRQCTRPEGAPDAPDAAQVGQGGGDDVDPGVGVVDPVHRHLVDPQAGALGQHQHLGVEEPAGVLDQRQEPLRDVGADGLEAALRVGESGLQRAAQQQVVAARDELPLRPADDPRSAAEPGADREVGVPGDQRGDQGQQGGEVGREVDVAVGEHGRVGGSPDRPQRPPAALLLEPDRRHGRDLAGQRPRDRRGGVGAGVVGDRDPVAVREVRGQVGVQAPDRRLEVGLLVVDGDDDVEHDAVGLGGVRPRILHSVQAGLRDVDAHVVHARPRRCPALVVDLCASCASDPIGCSGHEAVPVRS